MRTFLAGLIGLCLLGAAAGWVITAPTPIDAAALPDHVPDPEAGRTMFLIGGCASCHAAKGAEGEARVVLDGGQRFETEFGTFVAPNISTDPVHGIGRWSALEFVNAMQHGVSPAGEHYYPAFPYASYARMTTRDVLDLWGYMQTLPASGRPNDPHALGLPFSIRRGIGVWKLLHLDPTPIAPETGPDRGRYLVEGPGHCGECHTPRDATGGLDLDQWLGGAPSPDGPGRIPNITPGGKDIASWTVADIAEYLNSGFTPEYDTAGSTMVAVIANTSQLTDTDRRAMAEYLKALPAR